MYKSERLLKESRRLYVSENRVCRDFAEKICNRDALKSHGIDSIPGIGSGKFLIGYAKSGLNKRPVLR